MTPQTPIRFSLANQEQPIPDDTASWATEVINRMVEKAIRDRDGTLTLRVTPTEIECVYQPAPRKSEDAQ